MNLTEYENRYASIYSSFAETVQFIVKQAIKVLDNVPTPQSIQYRAKTVESLRRRLIEENKLESKTLENDRRDLAGVRLIFYTNNDVDRFLGSSLLRDNFHIEHDSTKIHHPIEENGQANYRAVHFTVTLRDDRTSLPEYSRFSGLRCEIQIQTILNHAWSETSHNILYKNGIGEGYGSKAMKNIAQRFTRIMKEYLIPAGFEMQKAQREFEQVLQGKELFDNDVVKVLATAANNNERHEILMGLRDYGIPNYGDLEGVFETLKDTLSNTVKAARETKTAPIEMTFGKMEGFEADAVTKLVVEIIDDLRYADVIGVLGLLIDIYRSESNVGIRKQITNVVKGLTEYRFGVYNQVGPGVQLVLVNHLAEMSDFEIESIRPLALTVLTEALHLNITGSKWTADSVAIHTGSLPVTDQLAEIRDKAINVLFAIYDHAKDDPTRRAVLSALGAAKRRPHLGGYSNELLAMTLRNSKRIAEFLTNRIGSTSYEVMQDIEHTFFLDYRGADGLTDDPENRFNCQAEAKDLVAAIFGYHDSINANETYIKFKVLVGFESIYPMHWVDGQLDFERDERYRTEEVRRYINEVSADNEANWFDLLNRCVETKSSDGAMFQFFGKFISDFSERKPDVAERCLKHASENLVNFLPAFLNGLARSEQSDIYEMVLDREFKSGKNHLDIIHHLRYSDVRKPKIADCILASAIEACDTLLVVKCLIFALQSYETEKIQNIKAFIRSAFLYLNKHDDASWTYEAWVLQTNKKFCQELDAETTALLLENLNYLKKLDFRVEQILTQVAIVQLEAVWNFFGDRFVAASVHGDDDERYEAIPFRFYGLEKELSKSPELAIVKGLAWFDMDKTLFQFRGGRLISNAFFDCTEEFSANLTELVKAGDDKAADFALAILKNFHGQPTMFSVLKEIVSKHPNDIGKMNEVRFALNSTGVVGGEFGFVEAYRAKKAFLSEWLTDDRQAVAEFADKHIATLELMIIQEQRRAEVSREMRKRDFDGDDPDSGLGS